MQFSHHEAIWNAFPQLVPWVLRIDGIHMQAQPTSSIERHQAFAQEHLNQSPEGEWPSIQAWRRAFSQMGLKPTQYRCAAESLLRRFRKEHSLPALHPLVDLCNAVSLAYGIPIAVFDLDHVSGDLQVCLAKGDERYLEFSGVTEQPEPGEVIFSDGNAQAHARRWCHRQSAVSAIRASTTRVLIVAEAMHAGADEHMAALERDLTSAIAQAWGEAVTCSVRTQLLTRTHPAIAFD